MNVKVMNQKLSEIKSDLLVVPMFKDEKTFKGLNAKLDLQINNRIKSKKFEGNLKQMFFLSSLDEIKSETVLFCGLGDKKEFVKNNLRKFSAVVAKKAEEMKCKSVCYDLSNLKLDLSEDLISQIIIEGAILGTYKFKIYKTDAKERVRYVDSLLLNVNNTSLSQKGAKKGQLLAETSNYVRTLVNTPPVDMYPEKLAAEAKKIATQNKIQIKILDKKELTKKKMNAILAVGRGSIKEPRMIMLQTNPKAKRSIALVGKGVTFDSGGLDIKPWPHMKDMKCDMAGAATVLGAVAYAAKMKLPINVIGVLGAVENMPGPDSYKGGDVIKSYMGKTLEVEHTDAEGRIVLADAVAYAEEQKPDAIVDIATLTGASVVCLGFAAAPFVSNNDKIKSALLEASKQSDEIIWELPLLQEYRDAVKGVLADVKNLGSPDRAAGTITGATFVEAFVKKTPWAHIDIGGMGWFSEEKEYVLKGGTGFGLRLFASLVENWK